jgi:hypothetical protein
MVCDTFYDNCQKPDAGDDQSVNMSVLSCLADNYKLERIAELRWQTPCLRMSGLGCLADNYKSHLTAETTYSF